MERYVGQKIKKVQTDLGGEFMNAKFKKYLEEQGINHKMPCAYTPQQHGIVEKRHRQIMEVGRCLMIKSKILHQYCPEVFSLAVYLINRLRIPILKNRSPYKLLLNKQPHYTIMKTLGCVCYPLLPKEGKNKVMPKSRKSVFLGYATN